MFISDNHYLNWQKKLSGNVLFRRFWVFLGIYSIVILLFFGIYFLKVNQVNVITLALLSLLIGRGVVSPLIYLFYKKFRPYQKLKFEPANSWFYSLLTNKANSFPSDHAISFAAISAVFIFQVPIFSWFLVPIVALNGIARVVLGYHYSLDVLMGWLVGIICAFLVFYYLGPLLFTHA